MRRKILAVLSFLLAFAAAALYAATFGRPNGRESLLVFFVVLNLLFWFIAFLLGRSPEDPPRRMRWPDKAPRWADTLSAVLFLFFFVHFGFLLQEGTPISQEGHFLRKTLTGDLVRISRIEYIRMKATETRAFSALWFALDVGLGLTLWFKDERPKHPAPSGHWSR